MTVIGGLVIILQEVLVVSVCYLVHLWFLGLLRNNQLSLVPLQKQNFEHLLILPVTYLGFTCFFLKYRSYNLDLLLSTIKLL